MVFNEDKLLNFTKGQSVSLIHVCHSSSDLGDFTRLPVDKEAVSLKIIYTIWSVYVV